MKKKLGKQKKAFITGITGQDGSYLAELLLKKSLDEATSMMKNQGLIKFNRDD